jgi:hypothetical protein
MFPRRHRLSHDGRTLDGSRAYAQRGRNQEYACGSRERFRGAYIRDIAAIAVGTRVLIFKRNFRSS